MLVNANRVLQYMGQSLVTIDACRKHISTKPYLSIYLSVICSHTNRYVTVAFWV